MDNRNLKGSNWPGQSSDLGLKRVKDFHLDWRQMLQSLSPWLAVTIGPKAVSPFTSTC